MLLLLAMFLCNFCGKDWPTDHSHLTHEGTCKKQKASTSSLFDMHKKAHIQPAEAYRHNDEDFDAPTENICAIFEFVASFLMGFEAAPP